MKKRLFFGGKNSLLMIIFFLLVLVQITEAANFRIKIKAAGAEIRLKPSVESTLISDVPLGAILTSSEKFGDWYKVNLPPDQQGIVVSGYIHQNSVEVIEVIDETPQQNIMKDEPDSGIQETIPPVREEKRKRFALRLGLGLAFPSGDWSTLFNLGLGAMIGNSFSLVQNRNFDVALIGSFDGYMFFREAGYTDISWARILLAGDLRLTLKVDQFSIFGQGGVGIYFDILEVSHWLWGRADTSEFRFGPRLGGGFAYKNIEILGIFHLVEDKMFSIMMVWTFGF